MQQTLEMLEKFGRGESSGIPLTVLVHNLREALAAQHEPVLFIHPDTFAMANAHVGAWKPGHELPGSIPLYTAPPAEVPLLTDGNISWLWSEAHNDTTDRMPFQVFARAVEQAVRQKAGIK